jgi:uncharacterized phage protein (TIGR01671 family)
MNNRLKFRVWDIDAQFYWGEGEGMDFKKIAFNFYDDLFTDTDRFIFQQYTGLKDINDKDIYEGDILSNGKEHDLCERYSMKSLYVVDYANGTYNDPLFYKSLNDGQFFKSEFPSDRVKNCDYSEMTIIGNILENRPLIDK